VYMCVYGDKNLHLDSDTSRAVKGWGRGGDVCV